MKEGENIDKDIKNNSCLPKEIYDTLEINDFKNIINIHRIRTEFNFLKDESIYIEEINTENYYFF